VSAPTALARIAVGVVVERRKSASPWIDVVWRPTGVLAGAPDAAPWTTLEAGDERASFYAGAAEIALYRTETGHYRDNLNSGRPSLWVSLRPTGAACGLGRRGGVRGRVSCRAPVRETQARAR
jgi:uncharacterized protein DUF3305